MVMAVSAVRTSPEMEKAMFAELRPLCVAVMSSPSCGSLRELRARVGALSPPLPPPLISYILLPLRTTIKKCVK